MYNAKECSNYNTVELISHVGKVMLKILQTKLQQYVNREFPDIQAGFKKVKGDQRSNCQDSLDYEKARESRKNIYFCFTDYAKPLTVWIITNCEKFLNSWEYKTTLPIS